jgi:hypothetical protein
MNPAVPLHCSTVYAASLGSVSDGSIWMYASSLANCLQPGHLDSVLLHRSACIAAKTAASGCLVLVGCPSAHYSNRQVGDAGVVPELWGLQCCCQSCRHPSGSVCLLHPVEEPWPSGPSRLVSLSHSLVSTSAHLFKQRSIQRVLRSTSDGSPRMCVHCRWRRARTCGAW